MPEDSTQHSALSTQPEFTVGDLYSLANSDSALFGSAVDALSEALAEARASALSTPSTESTPSTALAPIKALAQPHPLAVNRDWYVAEFQAGLTIRQIIGEHAVSCQVEIGGIVIPQSMWPYVRPKPGVALIITRFPQGGNAKSIISIIAFAALAVLTTGVATGVVFGLHGLAALGAAAAIGVAGSLILNALIPPQTPKAPQDTSFNPLHSITGSSNQANPYGAIPCVLGTIRMFPTLAVLPFSELSGDDQYVRFLFDCGYGGSTLALSTMKIGDNDLANFTDVETQIGVTPSLFSDDITEVAATDVLNTDGSQAVRTTAINADEIGVDLIFPNGLFGVDNKGNSVQVSVNVRIEQSPTGLGTWVALPSLPGGVGGIGLTISNPSASTFADVFVCQSSARKVFRVGFRWKPGASAQYDVRVTRVSSNWGTADSNGHIGDLTWSVIRTIRHTAPTSTSTQKVAMRIKATDQLNGTVNQFNLVGAQQIPVWNGTAWVTEPSDNPAFIFRWLLRDSPANPRTISPTLIDPGDSFLIDWATDCTAKEYTFSAVIDQQQPLFDLLKDVCAAGRASFTVRDGIYSVVRDVAQSTPIQHFSPRNTWGFQGHRSFIDVIHALRVQFTNAQANYQQDEIVVLDDGYQLNGLDALGNPAPALPEATKFETMPIRGCTNANGAWRLGRYHLAVARLRPNTYTWNCDIENLRVTRGDLVAFAHDVISTGLAWGRIKSVTTDISGNATSITVDEPVTIEVGVTYAVRIRSNDGSTKLTNITATVGDGISLFNLTTPQANVNPGDLFLFGVSGSESSDLIITKIQPGPDLSAQLTAVDYAPAVLSADTGPPPAFTSSITGLPWNDVPEPPEITFITSIEDSSPPNDGGVRNPIVRVGVGGAGPGRIRGPLGGATGGRSTA